MTFEILKDRIKPPAQNNDTWVFFVRVDEAEQQWPVDDFDLHLWFKEAVGRYPRHEGGDRDTLQDLGENWDRVEPRLRQELVRAAELDVVIGVDSDRPPLRKSEREAARALKKSDEDYARDLLAAERTRVDLIEKAEKLVRFLKQMLSSAQPRVTIKRVDLRTLDGMFDVEVDVEGKRTTMQVDEEVFDDLLQRGSEEAERRLRKILEVNLPVQVLR